MSTPAMIEAVCHDEQLEIWADEFVEHLLAANCEPQFDSYDEKLTYFSAVKAAIRDLVGKAFEHPALSAAEAAAWQPIGYMEAMSFAKRGFDDWAAKDHNEKWVRLIDGTPIENDLLVNIAVALSRSPPQTGEIK